MYNLLINGDIQNKSFFNKKEALRHAYAHKEHNCDVNGEKVTSIILRTYIYKTNELFEEPTIIDKELI